MINQWIMMMRKSVCQWVIINYDYPNIMVDIIIIILE